MPWLVTYLSDYRLALHPEPYPVFGHSWSLAVEEKFYLLWPLVVMTFSERRAAGLCIGSIVLASGLRAWFLHSHGDAAVGRIYYGFDTRFDSLMWGALLAFGLRNRTWFGRIACVARPAVLVGIFLVLLAYAPSAHNGAQHRYVIVPFLSAAILALYLVRPELPGARLLEKPVPAYVGRISYGIYVFHPLAISVAKRCSEFLTKSGVAQDLLTVVVAVLLSISGAGLCFRYFETWFLGLKERYR